MSATESYSRTFSFDFVFNFYTPVLLSTFSRSNCLSHYFHIFDTKLVDFVLSVKLNEKYI